MIKLIDTKCELWQFYLFKRIKNKQKIYLSLVWWLDFELSLINQHGIFMLK